MENGTAPHCIHLAWRNLWTEEPGRLQSLGSQSQTLQSDFHAHIADLSDEYEEVWRHLRASLENSDAVEKSHIGARAASEP